MDWSQVTQVGRRITAWFQRKIEAQEVKAQQDRDAVTRDLARSTELLLQRRNQPPSNVS